MATANALHCSCTILVAFHTLGIASGNPNWTLRSGPKDACKEKDESDRCSFSPFGTFTKIFSYTHKQQLDKSIKEVLQDRGLAEKQWFPLLRIDNQNGKSLDKNFLFRDDIFDGSVTPNDFPLTVYLKESWGGKCGGRGPNHGACNAFRSTLRDACGAYDATPGDECTYESLQLLKARLPESRYKSLPYSFKGKCMNTEGIYWCKFMTAKEHQIETCLGKMPGAGCMYSSSGKYEDMYKGTCVGTDGGHVLSCKGVKVVLTDACDGKALGDKCEAKGKTPLKGWCGFGEASLQCIDGSGKTPPDDAPAPAPPSEGASCSSMDKKVERMSAVLDKVAAQLGTSTEPEPVTPAPTPSKPSRRRSKRRRRKQTA